MMLIAFLVSTTAQWPPGLSELAALMDLPACSAPCAPIITAQYGAVTASVNPTPANPGLTCDQVNKNLNKCADKCTEAEFKQVLTAGLPFYMDPTASKTQMDSLITVSYTHLTLPTKRIV